MDTIPVTKIKTVDEVIDWITKIGFPNYVKIIADNSIDGDKLRNISAEQLQRYNVQAADVSLIMKRLEQDLAITKTDSTENLLQKKRKTDMQSDKMQLVWMRRPEKLLQSNIQWKRNSVESQNWRDSIGPMDLLKDSPHNPYPRIRVSPRYNDKIIIVKVAKASENDSFVEFQNQIDYLRGNEARVIDGKADFEDLKYMQHSFVLNKWECWFLKFEIADEPTEFIYSSPLKVRASSKQFLTTDGSKVLKVSPLGSPVGRSVDVAIVGVFPRGPTFSIFFGKKEATLARGKNRIDSKITNGSCILVNIQEDVVGAVPVKIVTKEPRVMCNEDKTFVWTDSVITSSPLERRSSESARIEAAGYESGGLFVSSFSNDAIDTEFDPLRGYSPLHWACGQGKFKVVEYLLEKGADVNLRDCEGATPLFWAAWTGNEQCIAHLLKKGASPNIPNFMGFSPLHVAVYRGSTTMVQMLLYYKADLLQVNIFDEPPVLFATEYSVKRLLSALDTPAPMTTKLPPITSLQDEEKKYRTDPNNNNNTYKITSPQTPRRETPNMMLNTAPAPVPLNWGGYTPQYTPPPTAITANSPTANLTAAPSQSDLSIILANKVIGDLNSLIQYLETTEPQLLMNSHLATAHYILNSFVSNLMQSQVKSSTATSTSPFAPPPTTSPPSLYNSPFVSQTKPISNVSYAMPASPFTPTASPTATSYPTYAPTSPKPFLPKVTPVAPVVTPVINPISSSTYIPPIPMNLSMFKQPVVRPNQINLSHIDFSNSNLNDFEFLDVLGTGTFAKVQLCKHKLTKKHFCMKILNKAKIVKLKQVDHVSNEKNVLRKISHPFIVKLYQTFKDKTNLYLLLEFIPGGELFNYIRKAGRLPNEIARIYAAEIILAFEYLHKQRIVYRDLKPENLLLDDFGHIKLTDFGFAKEVKERTFSVCGTPEYIAPEIILNKGHDVAVDWWSLGILIFEMLAGYPPFSEDLSSKQTVFEQILNQRVDIPDYFHPHARDIVQKLLVPDPSARVGFVKGMRDIKNHEWFYGIEWDKLYERRDCGPLNPEVVRDGDTHNFYKFSDVELQHELEDPSLNYDQIFLDF